VITDAIRRAVATGLAPSRKPPPLRLSEWAAKHFYLSAESSYDEQPWREYPYQRALLDCMSNDAIEEVVFSKSARVGYTKCLLAAVAYFAQHKHRNQAVWNPSDADSEEFVKTELESMIRDVPAMVAVFPNFLHHHKANTLRQKSFLGSVLHLRGGKAAKNYRRISISTAFLDELDAFDLDVEGEGSPVELARKRIEGATYPKLILGSTPGIRGLSMVESRLALAEKQFRFHVHCPHCDAEQTLRFGERDSAYGFKWVEHDPKSVAYLCESCGTLFRQSEYLAGWERARWLAPDGTWIDPEGGFRDAAEHVIDAPRSVGFHIWTAYSPQTDWSAIVRQFLSASKRLEAGDKSELKTFRNTTLGESWEEELEKADQTELQQRAEAYPLRHVPEGGLMLVAGIDTQDNRFEVVVWAIGRGEEMWAIDYMVIDANPSDERDWERLDAYLQTKFRRFDGGEMQIAAAAIDTGGHFTHQVYNFVRTKPTRRRIYAIRGDNRPSQPVKGRSALVDVNWRGKIIKSGVRLWHVGTDTAKDLLFGRLRVTQAGPGRVHFSQDLPPVFYDQLTAEARRPQRTARGEVSRWIRLRQRNETLDCTVYAIFASHTLGLHTYTEAMWKRVERKAEKSTEPAIPAPQTTDPADAAMVAVRRGFAPPRTGGFVKGWK
jgi:phage terminase large subunit GpA-like protein